MLVEQTRLLIKACGPSGPAGSIGIEPETQALFEAVLIHLRLLDEFLGNQGRDTDVRAVVMSPTTAECASVRTSSTVTFGGQLDASEAPPLEADRISDSRTGPPLRPNNRNPGRSPRSNLSSTVAGESPSSTPSSRAVSNLSVTPSSPVYARDSRRRSAPHSAMKGAHHARDVSAGLPIPGPDVLELARLVDDQALAERLETAYGNGARILALEIQERESILRALENGPPTAALAELRGTLLAEHVGRVRDGLV